MKRHKVLNSDEIAAVEKTVRMLLHASRDCMRNQRADTTTITWNVVDAYYAEAFGVMRGLEALGYGYLGSGNKPHEPPILWHNLRWWFEQLCDSVLAEEGFYDETHECDYCLEHHGKDATRSR